ncbi:uncharacterized protein BDZ83DRAFT_607301 [Colletotrichum acutatum]|uniref:Uncharacterized protein n=1 Tax=Glomerella acutata TaxID=27357 RepID=A0AAD9CYP5_GLOAC|nr:uncharacterized protein BDZ83DRAFT_607301 [Colletotrichum acutatum]KAK1728873.1 hypothetical protein BDZ83DRAFT_607301 [Colletotrichum acutatum]
MRMAMSRVGPLKSSEEGRSILPAMKSIPGKFGLDAMPPWYTVGLSCSQWSSIERLTETL